MVQAEPWAQRLRGDLQITEGPGGQGAGVEVPAGGADPGVGQRDAGGREGDALGQLQAEGGVAGRAGRMLGMEEHKSAGQRPPHKLSSGHFCEQRWDRGPPTPSPLV